MRGKVMVRIPEGANVGITPAYAGKRSIAFDHVFSLQDHPRLCGEKPFHTLEKYVLTGSPPPMRGKENLDSTIFLMNRITPAYAGKSCGTPETAGNQWDHPRLCGEKLTTDKLPRHCRGSPPPMRGKVCKSCLDLIHKRITPAYAGKRRCVHRF